MVPASAKQTFSSVACEVHRPPYLNIGGREKREKKKMKNHFRAGLLGELRGNKLLI